MEKNPQNNGNCCIFLLDQFWNPKQLLLLGKCPNLQHVILPPLDPNKSGKERNVYPGHQSFTHNHLNHLFFNFEGTWAHGNTPKYVFQTIGLNQVSKCAVWIHPAQRTGAICPNQKNSGCANGHPHDSFIFRLHYESVGAWSLHHWN